MEISVDEARDRIVKVNGSRAFYLETDGVRDAYVSQDHDVIVMIDGSCEQAPVERFIWNRLLCDEDRPFFCPIIAHGKTPTGSAWVAKPYYSHLQEDPGASRNDHTRDLEGYAGPVAQQVAQLFAKYGLEADYGRRQWKLRMDTYGPGHAIVIHDYGISWDVSTDEAIADAA